MTSAEKSLLVLWFASVAVASLATTSAIAAGPFDHLRCYRVQRDLRDVAQVDGLMLTSVQVGCRVRSARAYQVCVPVEKSPSEPPSGPDLRADYVCYRLRCSPPPANEPTQLDVRDQFGIGTLIVRQQMGESQTLCVPAPYRCELPSSPATLPVSDDFNRSNGTALGAAWVEVRGDFVISSNGLVSNFADDSVAIQSGINSGTVSVRADVDLAGTPTDAIGGLLLRATATCGPACPTFYLGRIRKEASTFRAEIMKTMNCTTSTLDSQVIGSQTGTVQFAASGTSLTLSFNNVVVAAATDSSIAVGTVGVLANGSGVRFDNFSAAD